MQISEFTKNLIKEFLKEDVGPGDITSSVLLDPNLKASAVILSREEVVLCGLDLAREIFSDFSLDVELLKEDGDMCEVGENCLRVSGCFASILTSERLVLNLMQHLTAIATKTSKFVEMVSHTGVKLLDTRKTTPGLRELEKYAVKCGGGVNHRFGLYDAVLIKNNHIDALGGDLSLAIKKARSSVPKDMKVEVEVRNQKELSQAVAESPDAILLDNMTPQEIKSAISYVRSQEQGARIELEASGGINEVNLLSYAETGVDAISLGCLTHSISAVDLALHYEAS